MFAKRSLYGQVYPHNCLKTHSLKSQSLKQSAKVVRKHMQVYSFLLKRAMKQSRMLQFLLMFF